MAKQKGIIKLEGTTMGLCFYKLNGEAVVRKASGPSAERIRTDPAFANVKKNNQEFAGATYLSKSIRKGLGALGYAFKDTYMASRLTGVCRKVIQAGAGPLGARTGDLRQQGDLLVGFALDAANPLRLATNFLQGIHATANRDQVDVVPAIAFPAFTDALRGVTHYQLTAVVVSVARYVWGAKIQRYTAELAGEDGLATQAVTEPIPLDTPPANLKFTLPAPTDGAPAASTALVVFLGVAFGTVTGDVWNERQTGKVMGCVGVV